MGSHTKCFLSQNSKFIITYTFEFTWITPIFSKKQHVRKMLYPTEKLIMFFQYERNKNRVRTGNFEYKRLSGAEIPRHITLF